MTKLLKIKSLINIYISKFYFKYEDKKSCAKDYKDDQFVSFLQNPMINEKQMQLWSVGQPVINNRSTNLTADDKHLFPYLRVTPRLRKTNPSRWFAVNRKFSPPQSNWMYDHVHSFNGFAKLWWRAFFRPSTDSIREGRETIMSKSTSADGGLRYTYI